MSNTQTQKPEIPGIPLKGMPDKTKDFIIANGIQGTPADSVIKNTLNAAAEKAEFIDPAKIEVEPTA